MPRELDEHIDIDLRGFNPAGVTGLALGSLTYLAILNPNTYIPNASFFPYTTASLPAVTVGGMTYVIASHIIWRLLPDTRIPLVRNRSNAVVDTQS